MVLQQSRWYILLAFLVIWAAFGPGYSGGARPHPAAAAPLDPDFGGLALPFVPNAGQSDPAVHFQAHALGGTLFFTPAEVVLSLPVDQAPAAATVRLQFEGANVAPKLVQTDPLPTVVNYLTGSDPSRWRTNIPTYAGLTYQALYDGIDLLYEGTETALKGTYVVAPGADPAQIRWRYEGVQQVRRDSASGDLIMTLPGTGREPLTLTEQVPIAWQEIEGRRMAVAVSYRLAADGTIGFATGAYDASQPLIIDPYLVYSALIGGLNDEEGRDIAVDGSGNVYLTGSTLSTDFPNAGPPQASYDGPPSGNFGDAFIAKLNPAGTALLYMTYLGGGGADVGDAITVDAQGNAHVTGMTESTDFPTTSSAFQEDMVAQNCSTPPCADAFVTKLNAAGNALLFSTFLGGSGEENISLLDPGTRDNTTGIAVDGSGNVYVTGVTFSTNFPTQNEAFDDGDGAFSDIFVSKLSANGQTLLYSSYLGGDGAEYGGDIVVGEMGQAYITGGTLADDFPRKDALQDASASPGIAEAIVARFDTTLSGNASLIYSSYLGGAAADFGFGIGLDSAGNIYVAGHTRSLNFPMQNAYQASNASAGQPNPLDGFVAKLNPAGSALLYSSYLGGSATDVIYGMDLDSQGIVYVTGTTNSDDFPSRDPWQAERNDFRDTFVSKLNPALSGDASLIYSTFFGSPLNDYSYGIAVDGESNAYITGLGSGVVVNDFPIRTEIGPHDTGSGLLVAKFGPPPAPELGFSVYLPIVIKTRSTEVPE